MKVAVVGGGITGLAAAWFLARGGAEVELHEAEDRPGGKLRTAHLGGVPVEEGPDTFLARVPWAVDLCRDLGLGDDLVEPATGRAYVWTRGRLRPLPPGTVLGVPVRPRQLAGLVPAAGVARAALDLVLPRSRWGDDPTVAQVVGDRLGPEVVDRLVEPLLGGIHAGRADRLSLRSVAPRVASAAAAGRSLMRSLRRLPPPDGGPVFLGIRGGMARLVDSLVAALPPGTVRTGSAVGDLAALDADAVVLAVPARAAAGLVGGEAARDLAAIGYASVVTVTLAYPRRPLDGSGYLVPRVDGRLLTACTWTTAKWDLPGDRMLLRASAGRAGDDRAMALDDDRLVAALHAELDEAMGLPSEPAAALVTRWPRAFPQYDSGHRARVARIEAALPAGVVVAGAAYRGVGIAACVHQARQAADRVLAGTTRAG